MYLRHTIPAVLMMFGATPLYAAGDDFERLVDTLASQEKLMAEFESTAPEMLRGEFDRDPDMAEIGRECPQLYPDMTRAMMPVLVQSQRRGVANYRTQLLELFRNRLEPDEAAAAADFYTTETGQKLMALAEEHANFESSLDEIRNSDDAQASIEALRADKEATRRAIKAKADPALLWEAGLDLAGKPWLKKVMALKPEMEQLELALANDDFTAGEEKALGEAVDTAVTKVMDACYSD